MACQHPPASMTSDLRFERHRVRRVYKCGQCGRIVKRTRSRWANRADRRRAYREADRSWSSRGWQQRRRINDAAVETERLHKRKQHGAAYAEGLIAEMKSLEWQAKRLPQDDRHWKYAPEAIRYRRLLRRWWALPNGAVEGLDTPTSGLRLTTKGRAEPPAVQIPPFSHARVQKAAAAKGAEHFRYRLFEDHHEAL